MPNNQNNMSQSLKKCVSEASKPFRVASHWYCGPSDTREGIAARAICGISTALMISSTLLYCAAGGLIFEEEYRKRQESAASADNIYDPDWPLSLGSICTFTLALFGYLIVTPVIGHRCCGAIDAVYGNRNIAIADVEQPIQQENHVLLNSNNTSNNTSLPSYEEATELQPTLSVQNITQTNDLSRYKI